MTKAKDRGVMAKICPVLRRERPFDCAGDRAMLGIVPRPSPGCSRRRRGPSVSDGLLAGGGL